MKNKMRRSRATGGVARGGRPKPEAMLMSDCAKEKQTFAMCQRIRSLWFDRHLDLRRISIMCGRSEDYVRAIIHGKYRATDYLAATDGTESDPTGWA